MPSRYNSSSSSTPSRAIPIRFKRLKGFWGWLLCHLHLALPTAACVLTLCSTYILLGPVLNRAGDNMYHLLNQYAIAHTIQIGDSPFGPLGMEFGQPVLRFYQALFYLYNVGLYIVTGIDLKLLHNIPIVVCFSLSPFAYYYFLKKLGTNKWAAALGSFASMTSVAAFGNSFEAYHQAGIVTQSMGGLFFPWFMGNFIGMLRGENRASSTAALFSLAFLSHAILSVFAVFGGVLFFLVTAFKLRDVWKKLLAFSLFCTALVAFWVMPFLAHTYEMRPVPDSIVRGTRVHWFTSVSKEELMMVLNTGRLLDDPPRRGKERDTNDKVMDRISIIGTLKTRPPAITALTGLGTVVALFGLGMASRRFLLAGLLFSLMLFAGPDDYRWLHYLPFIKQIQVFRCTYFVEFFAFGLVGVGAEAVFRRLWMFIKKRKSFIGSPMMAAWMISVSVAAALCGSEIILLGQRHLLIRDPSSFDEMIDAVSEVPERGYPFRIAPIYTGRYKLRHAWFAVHGYQPYCTHWKGTGPTAAYHLCMTLASVSKNNDLHALAGIRYFSGQGDKIKRLHDAKDRDGDPLLERLPNGKERNGKSTSWHYMLDSGREHFLRLFVGKPLPVVCSNSQWIWITKEWMKKYRSWLWQESTPFPMRVRSGSLDPSGLSESAHAIFYLDHKGLKEDLPGLQRFVKSGGVVISPVEIDGLKTIRPENKQSAWDILPKAMKRPSSAKPEKNHREELDPAFEFAEIKRLPDPDRSPQNFAFDIDLLEPILAVLPMQAVPGWKATLNGKPLVTFPTGPDMVGVYLPKGAHRLVFYWEMIYWHLITIWVTLLAVAVVIGIWIHAVVRRVRPA